MVLIYGSYHWPAMNDGESTLTLRQRFGPLEVSRLKGPVFLWLLLCSPLVLGAWLAPEPAEHKLEDRHLRLEYSEPMERALWLGVDWFLRDQNIDGSFRYQYDLATDSYSAEENIIRQAGSAYALAYLCGYTGEPEHCQAAERFLGYLKGQLVHDGSGAYVRHYSVAATGATALGLVAFATYQLFTGSIEYQTEMAEMAQHVMAMQRANGSFDGYYKVGWFFNWDRHAPVYSGEAMYALALMYRLTGEPAYKSAYDRALPWYIDFWDDAPDTMFYAWGAKAGYHMYLATGNASYAQLTFTMSDWIVRLQNRDEAHEGYGSYHYEVSIGSATYSEGVGDSLYLAVALNDTQRIAIYSEALNLSVHSILKLQVDPQLAETSPRPLRALGGFRSRPNDTQVRIDHTQHAITAIVRQLKWETGDFDVEVEQG